jgi:hypothetical protein
MARDRKLRAAATVAAAAVASALVVVAPAQAEIVSTSGDVVEITPAPGTDLNLHQFESDTEIRAFDEQQNVTLAAPLLLNINQPGTYDEQADLTGGQIPAGTVVSSHFVHADQVGTSPAIHLDGCVTVDDPIVGIITGPNRLRASDFLGHANVTYPAFGGGVEFEQQDDVVIWQVDDHTVCVDFHMGAHSDQIRVITSGEGQGCTPGYWKQPHHFDSWQGFAPGDDFDTVFSVSAFSPDKTLIQALNLGGGGLNALARHAVAALLNSASSGVDYPLTTAQVIAIVQTGVNSGNYESAKNQLASLNEGLCVLD